MNRLIELRQCTDNSWIIEVPLDNGLTRVETLPQLSKVQAISETTRRGYSQIRVWDKHVLQAIADGEVDRKRSRIE